MQLHRMTCVHRAAPLLVIYGGVRTGRCIVNTVGVGDQVVSAVAAHRAMQHRLRNWWSNVGRAAAEVNCYILSAMPAQLLPELANNSLVDICPGHCRMHCMSGVLAATSVLHITLVTVALLQPG
jgi:hypothetical protein